jgi:enoyl-CoA hydratase/carnithine racemase
MHEQQSRSVEAEARLYALETAVRVLVTVLMRDQPQALASIVASIRKNASSHIDQVFADEDKAVREQMRQATLDDLEQILTPFQMG